MEADNSISVVITCFSEGKLLLEAIESALNQSVAPTEIIVVNDATTHAETISVCKQLEANPVIQVIWRSSNGGPSVAREDGFKAAEGDIFVPLDADDILPVDAIKTIQNAFNLFPNAGFIYGKYIRQNQLNESILVEPGAISLNAMLRSKRFSLSSCWTLIGTAPLRRSLWETVGGCDLSLGREDLHDLEFWIRAMSSCHYYYVPEVIYVWRRYLGTNSRKVTPLSWYRVAKKHFDVYCQNGLEYRAYELLLLGSKWCNDRAEIQRYSQALICCIRRGCYTLPTLVALLIPAWLFRALAAYAVKHR